MAWIYLAESADSLLPWTDMSGRSPIVKVIDMPKQSSCLDRMTADCLGHRSGMTSEHCGDRCHLAMGLTLYTEDFPARTLALQALEKAWQASEAGFFSRSCGWPKKSDPSSYSLRMSPQLELVDSTLLGKNWPVPGMTADGILYPLKKLEHYTSDAVGFVWPTPVANDDNKSPAAHMAMKKRMNGGPNQTLKGKPALTNQAVHYTTPQARDWKDGLNPKPHGRHSESVAVAVAKDGHKGYLNPQFVEMLMGFRVEWTALEDWAMQWFRPKRERRLKD